MNAPERDRALLEIVRPEDRDPRPEDERRERERYRPELARAAVTLANHLPEQREPRCGGDAVEGHEQVGVIASELDRDPHRDAGEHREGEQPRPPEKRPGERDGADQPGDTRRREQRHRDVRCEVQVNGTHTDHEQRETGDARAKADPGSDQRQPCGADDAADLREHRHAFSPRQVVIARSARPRRRGRRCRWR